VAKKKDEKAVGRSGLSCLRPTTLDEDTEAFTRSPERRGEAVTSPGGRSISDIFGKQVSTLPFSLLNIASTAILNYYRCRTS
jgi:hypothetical protein